MERNDILCRLEKFPYDRREYRVITGAAMVLYGVRERTHDVDIGCSCAMADALAADGVPFELTESGRRHFRYSDDIEIFEGWLPGTSVDVDGVPVVSLDGLLAMKRELGREKDRRDIELIKAFLTSTSCARFCAERYWLAVLSQEAERIRALFAPDAVIDWPCTGESFTPERFAAMNREYPGRWAGQIERVVETDGLAVCAARIASENGGEAYHAVSFLRHDGEKILSLTEYWGDDTEPPEWRQE